MDSKKTRVYRVVVELDGMIEVIIEAASAQEAGEEAEDLANGKYPSFKAYLNSVEEGVEENELKSENE